MTQKEFNDQLDSFAETIIDTLAKDKLDNTGLCMGLIAAHLTEIK